MKRGPMLAALLLGAAALIWAATQFAIPPRASTPSAPDDAQTCSSAADCPAELSAPARCVDHASCQGTRREAVCEAGRCSARSVDDDSACDRDVIATPCNDGPDVTCNGAREQSLHARPCEPAPAPSEPSPSPATACEGDESCGAAAYCDRGQCRPRLPDGADCERPAMCLGARCGQHTCCSSGYCCRTDADCPSQRVCVDIPSCRGTRTDRACRDHSCVETSTVDDSEGCVGQVARQCGNYADVQCEAGRPPAECARACRAQSDCRPGNACVDGECHSGCNNDAECDRAQVCLNRACLYTCPGQRACPPRLVCVQQLDSTASPERSVEVCLDL